jgi:adenylate cyclase
MEATPESLRECAVLFADVSGSTKLYEAAGDTIAHAAIGACVEMFRAHTAAHGGRTVKTIGDEVMAEFPSAAAAMQAAVEMQHAISAMPAPVEGFQLGVRIGFHFGPVVDKEGDVFGDTVNLAARLSGLASKGQIITSAGTVELLPGLQRMDCRALHSIEVKGKAQSVGICEVLWHEPDDATTIAVSRRAIAPNATSLTLSYRGSRVLLPRDGKSITLGRDASAGMVIADRMASRIHCEIEQRMDKFVLVDRSANGTSVSIDGQGEMVLRREECILRGHGYIALGQARDQATELIEFICA